MLRNRADSCMLAAAQVAALPARQCTACPDARDCPPLQVASDSAEFMTATLARHIAGVSQLNHAGLSWNQQQPPGAGDAEGGAAGQPALDRLASGTQPTSLERSLSNQLQVLVALRFSLFWGWGGGRGGRPSCLAHLHAWSASPYAWSASPYVHPGASCEVRTRLPASPAGLLADMRRLSLQHVAARQHSLLPPLTACSVSCAAAWHQTRFRILVLVPPCADATTAFGCSTHWLRC